MKLDDDGQRHAVTLDEAAELLAAVLEHGDNMAEEGGPWVSHVAVDGKDRGERTLYVEITHPSGVCEPFQISITRGID